MTVEQNTIIINSKSELESARAFTQDLFFEIDSISYTLKNNFKLDCTSSMLDGQVKRINGIMYLLDDVINRLSVFDV